MEWHDGTGPNQSFVRPRPLCPCLRVLVNDDVAAADRLIRAVVIHGQAGSFIPDLDPERVGGRPPLNGTVFRRQKEAVVPKAVDRARSFELCLRSAHHEPLVLRAEKVELALAKGKLRPSARDCRTILVLGHESKVGFTLGGFTERREGAETRARLDPPAARHKAPRRVIHHEIAAGERTQI